MKWKYSFHLVKNSLSTEYDTNTIHNLLTGTEKKLEAMAGKFWNYFVQFYFKDLTLKKENKNLCNNF